MKWREVNNVLFIPSKCEKSYQLKHKMQVRDRVFIECYVFEYEGLCFSLRGKHIKDKRLHLFH